MTTYINKGAALAACALLAALASCDFISKAPGAKPTETDGITNFPISETIKSSVRRYRMSSDSDTCWLSLSATVQWPERIADYDIAPLRAAIVQRAFGLKNSTDIDNAMLDFTADSGDYVDSETYTRTDTVSEVPAAGINVYYADVNARINELTPDIVTYFVTKSTYLGGAHPNSSSEPFTYLFAKDAVVTYADIFREGTEIEVGRAIVEALERQYNVPSGHLSEAGFFSDSVDPSKMVYIDGDAIVFHYNPYDIAPYSTGPVDAEVSAWQVSDLLNPWYRNFFAVEE
ncbi:MAG: RsiV family protein [Clostridium sp.]|nr:RsiV family protein [Clostridium sp.]